MVDCAAGALDQIARAQGQAPPLQRHRLVGAEAHVVGDRHRRRGRIPALGELRDVVVGRVAQREAPGRRRVVSVKAFSPPPPMPFTARTSKVYWVPEIEAIHNV